MNNRCLTLSVVSIALLLCTPSLAHAEKTVIKGAAILDHPCGKIAVKHMALVHAGKMEEATKLGTKEMQEQWQKLPASDRTMMTGMMKEMSQPEPEFSALIKASGALEVDGKNATLSVATKHQDANGSSSETWTQKYVIDQGACLITH